MDFEEQGIAARLLKRILASLKLPLAHAILYSQSFGNYIKSLFKKTRIVKQTPFSDGSPILLLAVWQYENLRPDVLWLLELSKKLGLHTLVVNTGSLEKENVPSYADDYVEIPNFGRDFASYKFGFRRIYERGWNETTSRVIMCNDSVFYMEKGLEDLLIQSLDTDAYALGATENFEFERHLGSFFISLAPKVLKHRKFKQFWFSYRRTDIRPKVIWRGELRLSRVLKKVVPPHKLQARWSIGKLVNEIREKNLADLETFFRIGMRGNTYAKWKKSHLPLVAEEFRNRIRGQIIKVPERTEISLRIEEPLYTNAISLDELVTDLSSKFPQLEKANVKNEIFEIAGQSILATAANGSQIHNSAMLFVFLNCPIVKLDCLYRGTANYADLLRFAGVMSSSDFKSFSELVSSRAYGGETLVGWRLAAFDHGLL